MRMGSEESGAGAVCNPQAAVNTSAMTHAAAAAKRVRPAVKSDLKPYIVLVITTVSVMRTHMAAAHTGTPHNRPFFTDGNGVFNGILSVNSVARAARHEPGGYLGESLIGPAASANASAREKVWQYSRFMAHKIAKRP
jgi:hypothetical protein